MMRHPESATPADTEALPARRTRQRSAITERLERAAEFLTAQQIHDDLHHAGAGIGLATVYRTLQAMADTGEVDVIRTPAGQAAYRRCTTGHHHHLICRDCGTTVEISAEDVEAWLGSVAERHGFVAIDHELEMYGRCADCARALATASAQESVRGRSTTAP